MKTYLIKVAKKNEWLYRIAKRCYRMVRPAKESEYRSSEYLLAYAADKEEQLARIRSHYANLAKTNTRLLILWQGDSLSLHRLMRQYPTMLFLSMAYYARYHQRLMVRNLILLDIEHALPSVLRYL